MPIEKLRQKIDAMKGERSTHWTKATELMTKAETEKRSLTPEEQVSYREFIAKMDALKNDIELQETQLRQMIEMEGKNGTPMVETPVGDTGKREDVRGTEEYRSAFLGFMKGEKTANELRAMAKNAGAENGIVLVPTSLEVKVNKYLDDFSVMRRNATVRTSGTDLTIAFQSNRGSAGWVSESGTYPTTDDGFKSKSLGAYKMGRIMKISEELLQDAVLDLEDHIAKSLAESFAELEEVSFTRGRVLGTEKEPEGFVHKALTQEALTTNAITFDELKDLRFGIKQKYKIDSKWMMNTNTFKAISKIRNNVEDYILQPSITSEEPDRIMGFPVEINEQMDDIAAGKKPIAFGVFKEYLILDRLGLAIKKLAEKYADEGMVGVLGAKRTDGALLNEEAIIVLKMKTA